MAATVRERVLVITECLAKIAADLRKRPKAGRDIHVETRIRRAHPALEHVLKELLREIQLAFTPARGRKDVERVPKRVAVVPQLRCRHRRFRAVGRGMVVRVELVRAGDPAQEHGCHRRRCRLDAAQGALVERARFGALSQLVERTPFLYQRARRGVRFLRVHQAEMRGASLR